jgi:hypothetical protein
LGNSPTMENEKEWGALANFYTITCVDYKW